eukprot:2659095-Prymnesium_polylepis.2
MAAAVMERAAVAIETRPEAMAKERVAEGHDIECTQRSQPGGKGKRSMCLSVAPRTCAVVSAVAEGILASWPAVITIAVRSPDAVVCAGAVVDQACATVVTVASNCA